jgi:excisionase family DNA binding protein
MVGNRGRTPDGERGDQLVVTVEEAARRLCISRSYLYLLMNDGTLPSIAIGSARRIAVSDLEDLIDRLRTRSTRAPKRQPRRLPHGAGLHTVVDVRMSTPSETEV